MVAVAVTTIGGFLGILARWLHLEVNNAKVSTRIGGLERTHVNDIENVKRDQLNLRAELASLRNDMSVINTRVSSSETGIQVLNSKLDSLNKQLDRIEASISKLGEK